MDPYSCLWLVAEDGVERFGFVIFDLCFNVRDAALRATFMRSFKKGAADALVSGFRSHVEVFDAGEQASSGDVEAVGDDGYAQYLVLRPGGQYLYVSGFDGPA